MIKMNENGQFEYINENPLIMSDYDRNMYHELIDLVNRDKCHYSGIINGKAHQYLKEWILSKTQKLVEIEEKENFKFQMSTHVFWILDGRQDFPFCLNPNCNKQFGFNLNVSLAPRAGNPIGYRLYCSDKCKDSSPIVKEHRRQTNQERMNVDNPFQSEEVKQKSKETWLIHFGYDSPSKSPEVQAKMKQTRDKRLEEDPNFNKKIVEKCEATKERNHGDPHYNNIEQIKLTNLERRGVEFPTEDPSVIALRQENNMKKYGVKEILMLPGMHECSVSAIYDKFGVSCTFELPEFRERCISTMIDTYGVPFASQIPGMTELKKQRCLSATGYEWPSQIPAVKEQIIQTRIKNFGTAAAPSYRFTYKNMNFDSSTELTFWIFCEDNDIDIKRSSKMYEYYVDGQKCIYNVDFEVNGVETEIKGDQFFREDGTMFCPYRYSTWTDEQYEKVNRKYEAKHQCMLMNGVKILRSSELEHCRKYVNDKYGRDYLYQFKKRKADTTTEN